VSDLIQELLQRAPVITDGAWGTQLQARGLRLGESAEAWNLTHREQVEAVASSYVDAGSQIILSNTFGANRLAMGKHGMGDQAAEISRRGAEISKAAAGDRAKVFASLGPSGKMLLMDEVTREELQSAFAEQAEALAAGGADGIVVETMTDVEEAALAVAAARETGLPVVASMVFDSGPERDRTIMGATPEEAVTALEAAGADVIGSNCGQGIEGFVSLSRRLSAATDRPIWIKGNAGLPEVVDGEIVYHTTAAEFAGFVPALKAAGASFIGGCCGTGPEFVAALSRALTG
jgi:5-methyltetrahydrofolate--homocysteine methyltransferase